MNTRKFAVEVLKKCDKPLSYTQIWKKGQEFGFELDEYKGKTDPWQTIYSIINQDITIKGSESEFVKYSSNPALFGLKSKAYVDIDKAIDEVEEDSDKQIEDAGKNYNESDLHVPLVSWLTASDHFRCLTKTITQQTAKKTAKGIDQWTFPDLIGVYFPYMDFDDLTIDMLNTLKTNTIRVFSFEVKKELTASSLRENYFQAVSNSSWANEGYLVAATISEDESFIKELDLLCNAFGIGVIKLDIESPENSTVLKLARGRDNLEMNVLNKLIERSPEVRGVFETVRDSGKVNKVVGVDVFDSVWSFEEYREKTNGGKKLKGISGRCK